MKPRKYSDVFVGTYVNVSSSFHYHFDVSMAITGTKDRKASKYSYRAIVPPGAFQYPQYILKEIERKILGMLRSGSAVFYEYDRDGNKRYENLRYHEPEQVAWMIKRLEAEYGETQTT